MNDDKLSEIICEIFEEKTVVTSTFGKIYFRHFKPIETISLFSKKKFYLDEAIKKGIPQEEEAIKRLYEDGSWTPEEEKLVQEKGQLIQRLKDGFKSIKIPSKRDEHKELLDFEVEKLRKLEETKKSLIGLTAEDLASKKVNREFFNTITFLDPDFKFNVIDNIEYDEVMKEAELNKLQSEFVEKFNDTNVSRASLCPFFSPYMGYCESVLDVYGKPLKDLTTFQVRLLSYGKSFLQIFKNCPKEIPDNVSRDPEMLMQFFEAAKQQKNNQGKATEGAGGTTYFGATKEDMIQMAGDNETVIDLAEETRKKGGRLNMEEMMKLHGV